MRLREFNAKSFLFKAAIPCAMILIVFFTYGDVRRHRFLDFDDTLYITENSHVRNGLTIGGIRWAFGFVGENYWHPVTWISHMLDCQLFGLAPGAHLMVNVAIHALNALLLFLIIFRITGMRYRAAIVALLFAVHPLNVESVAWAAERKNVLSALFFMVSLFAYVHYAEKRKIGMYCLVLCAYALGLMSKPGIVTLPFLLLLLDYWPLKRFDRGDPCRPAAAPWTSPLGRFRARLLNFRMPQAVFLLVEKVPLIILSLASYVLSMISMSNLGMIRDHVQIPMGLRIANLFVSVVKYLWNMAWPLELSIYYPFPQAIPTAHFLSALTFVLLVSVMVALWRKNRPWLFTGWFWFLIALAPAGGLIQMGLWSEMANRHMYIPMIGLFLMLVWECDERIRGAYSKTLKAILCCALLVYCISLTKVQSTYFSNSYAVFTRSLEVTGENFIAYTGIGSALLSLHRVDEAMIYFEKAIALNPKALMALTSYGTCLAAKGDYINAGLYFSRAIDVNPKFAAPYANLGLVRYRMGYPEEAKKLLAKALELDPDHEDGRRILGSILGGDGKTP
jgi:hypothetical protein